MTIGIAVFARAPVPGQAKTRLIPRLGADGAARLQARLIDATLATACALPAARCTLWVAGDAAHPALAAAAQRHQIEIRTQAGADLGARMHGAVAATLARPLPTCLVIGTDCPALGVAHLDEAAAALTRHDAVLGPAHDGGYVLIGLTRPQRALFEGIAWGTADVLEQTRARLRAAGLTWHELPVLPDLDTPQDYDEAVAHGWLAA